MVAKMSFYEYFYRKPLSPFFGGGFCGTSTKALPSGINFMTAKQSQKYFSKNV
jgi:hypothetical protein